MVSRTRVGLHALARLGIGIVGVIVWGNCLLLAQNFSGTISGVVRDASGAVIPQATVTVRNTETGQTRIAETGVNGSYTVPSLPVGPYELTVEKPGFRQLVRSGINLSVGQEAAVNLTLEVGNVTQTVEVTGEAPLVNTTLSETSGLITEQQLKDMPLNGRSFHQLMLLNPNTVDNRSNSGAASFSVAGKRTENNRWTMNGVDYVGDNSTGQQIAPNGLSGQLLGIEAVREFNVLGSTYGAEYGKRSGGQVTAVTISGTNQLHGTVFEYLRNSALDARNFFDTEDRDGDGKIDATPLRRNQFGASLGGPIIRDKMFLYGNYEGYRQRRGESSDEFVPSAQARLGLLPCYIATPAACPESAGLAARNAYVPVPNLEPRMLPYAQLFWPAPNGGERFLNNGLATGIARATSNPVRGTEEDYGLARFDYNVSSADSISANFSVDEGRDSDPEDNTLFRGADTRDLYLLSVQETHIFSPTILNVATFGASRAGAVSSSAAITPIPENLVFLRSETRNSPGAIVIGGGATAAQASSLVSPNPQNPFYNNRQYYTGSNDLSMTRGRHNLKMGVWFQRVQQAAFSSAQQNAGTAGYPTVLAFLQDRLDSFGFQANPTELLFRSTQAAWYFQDEIKLRPNLTVRLGIRDESTTGWNEANGHSSNYLYTGGVINIDPLIGRSPFVENHAIALWQPRVGVAWDPGGTGKWAVRAGFGIHNDLQDNLTHRLNSNPPFAARVTIENTPLHSLIPVTGGQALPTCRAGSPLVPPACSTFAPGGLDPIMHTPTIQEWSLTVEREITQDFAVQIGYVGSQSYHVSTSIDMNTVRPLRCEDPAGCLAGGILAASQRVTVPQGTEYVPWAPRVDPAGSFRGYAPRPNPYINSTQTWMYLGTASSHGGHVSLLKRARAGLTFKTNYTFSKVIDLDSAILSTSGTNDPATILNPYNLKLNRGIASYSLAHVFNTNSSYELPFGRGKAIGGGATGWVDKVIGGWQWNGILTVQGGFPITPWIGANRSGNGDSRNPDLPNYNPNFQGKVIRGVDGIKKDGRYFDPNAFERPLAGTFGHVSRGSFRGPGFFQVDTSFFKQIPLTERLNMQFRAEIFNLLNHVNFDTPSPVLFSGNNIAGSAGVVNETISGNERQIQFALRLEF